MRSALLDSILRRPIVWCLVLGVLAAGSYFAAELYLLDGRVGFPLDDSWIHLQFARNMAAGEGLSYNPGDQVTGSTAPLWTAILALLFWLPGDPAIWAKVVGILCYLAVIPATFRLAIDLGVRRGLATLAAASTAVTSWLVWSALSGMEIPLFAFLSLTGMSLHLRERRGESTVPFSAIVLGLAALARPEGLGLLVAALADRLLVTWTVKDREVRSIALRRLGVWLALVALVVVPTLIYYRVVGGSFLPTTYAAKAPGPQRWLPSSGYLYVVLGIFFPAQPLLTLLACAGIVVLIARLGTSLDVGLLPAMWLLGVPLAYGLISPLGPNVVVGNFGRYYFPFFPVVVVLGVLAIDALWRQVAEGRSRLLRGVIAAAGAIALLLPTVMDYGRGVGRYGQNVVNVEDSDVAMARWLKDRLPEEALLAVNDIGALKYMLPNEVVDLAGIAHPELYEAIDQARELGLPWRRGIERFVTKHQPDYLVVFPSWYPQLTADRERFHELHRIAIPNNVTMGGDELVLYSTPWTRYPLRP